MSYIYFLALLNVVLAFVMIVYNWKLNRNIFHFSLFLLTVSATSVLFDTVLNGGSAQVLQYSSVFAVSISFYAAPSLYLFIRGLITDKVLFDPWDLVHLLPMVLSLLVLVPWLFGPEDIRMEFAINSLGNMSYYMNAKLYFLPNWLHEVIQIGISLIYLLAAIVLLNKGFTEKFRGLRSEIRQQYTHTRRWLNILLSVSLMLVILRVGLVLYFLTDPEDYNALKNEYQFALSTSVNTALTLLVMLNPRLMYGFPQPKRDLLEGMVENALVISASDSDIQPTAKTPMHNEYFAILCSRILEEMELSKPYLMPEFNVYHLTVSLDTPHHHIQFCINNIMNKKFAEFKNEYRVQYAIGLMKTEKHIRKTLATIGNESGFPSASAFYSVFSEITGVTPNQWIKENT